jgi:GNAT superfamily N-acetyltransferase
LFLKCRLRHSIRPGDIGYVVYLHGIIHGKELGFDATLDAYVADGLAEFVRLFRPVRDRIWIAESDDRIVGSVAIVGRSALNAQLRWFLVHPDFQKQGIGRRLLKEALKFSRRQGYKSVFLWTVSELEVARRLYTEVGFKKTKEQTHRIWGRNVTEERYDLHL